MRLIVADQFKKYRTELTDDMSPLERMYLIGRNDMVAIIESAPTVEYRWIPVTERLSEPFMTSPIGDLPINGEGLQKAIDEIVRLREINQALENDNYNLEMNLSRMEKMIPRWIPVAERLPEYDPCATLKSYWVAYDTRNGKQMQLAVYSDYMYATTTSIPPCVTWRDYESHKIKNVTHWMPLPEPPKEGE